MLDMMTQLRTTSLVPHAIAAAVPLSLGLIVGWYSRRGGDGGQNDAAWYASMLRKPAYSPPAVAFGVVWPVLYVLLGAAVFGATAGSDLGSCAAVYSALALNLLFNLSYPLLMFRARDLLNAMLATWATLLTAVLLLFVVAFVAAKSMRRTLSTWPPTYDGPSWITTWKRIAPLLLLPYVLWLAFASILATAVFVLNTEGMYLSS